MSGSTQQTPNQDGRPGSNAPIEQIRHLLDIGRTDQAIDLLGDSLTTEPSSGELLRLLSRAEHSRGNFQAATDAARAALAVEPDSVDSRLRLAIALTPLDYPSGSVEAMDLVHAALATDPHRASAYVIRAHIFISWVTARPGTTPLRGRQCYRAALGDVDHAIELNPSDADVHNLRGRLLDQLGKRGAAKAAWRRAIEIDPQHSFAQARLAKLAFDEDRISLARRHAGSGVAVNPQDPGLRRQVNSLAKRRLVWPLWFASLPSVASPRVLDIGQTRPSFPLALLPLTFAVISALFTWWSWRRTPPAERNALLRGGARFDATICTVAWVYLMAVGIAHAFVNPVPISPHPAAEPDWDVVDVLWNAGLAAFFLVPIWVVCQKPLGLIERIMSGISRAR